MAPDLSVVLPIYHNLDTLQALYERLKHVCELYSLSFEMICVNDACPLGSEKILALLSEQDPKRVFVFSHPHNRGQSAAILTGLSHARGSVIGIMDADLQDEPEQIPVLLEELKKGFDLVFAARLSPEHAAWWDNVTSKLFKIILSRLTGLPKNVGMFCVFKASVKDRVLNQEALGPFLLPRLAVCEAKMTSVTLPRHVRKQGRSSYSFKKRLMTGLRLLFYVLKWKATR
jgi:glycosyltransferase involved in cell wall biosynthesis